MKHLLALILKFITGIIAYTLGLDLFFNATWVDIITFSLLMTVVTYLLGDLILLRRIGNSHALLADFVLTYMIVWIFGSVLLNNYLQIAWGSIISATIIFVGEVIVHRLLLANVEITNDRVEQSTRTDHLAYSMEIAEENDPYNEK